MRFLTLILCFFIGAMFIGDALAQDEAVDVPVADDAGTDDAPQQPEVREEAPPVEPEKPAEPAEKPAGPVEVEGTGLDDEGLFEDALPARKKRIGGEKEKMAPGPRKLTIDAVVVVNYKFTNPAETYSVKYHINMGGEMNSTAGLIKGNAKVATDIGGFLAKSSAFECLLKVSIADVPYEIIFKEVNEKEADISVAFKGQILEDWESLCTFLDTSGAKFNTRGSPERWIGNALEKAKPPLSKLTAPLERDKTTTLKFSIAKYTIEEEGLGKAEIDGTGVVTIDPERLPLKE